MNSIRCSEVTRALVFLVVLLAAVGTASAISVSAEGLPAESAVGDSVTVTYTIEDPFTDAPNQWTLRGQTELTEVRWTVTVNRAGSQVGEHTYTNQSFNHSLNVDGNGDQIVVRIDGTTPAIENYSYAPEETYRVASLTQVTGNNTEELANDSAHHYTAESREARQAIESAEAAIEDAGGNQEAEDLLDSAKSAYVAENFDNAVDLANNAQNTAEQAQQSRQTTNTLLIAGGVLLVIALVGGGIYRWQSGKDDYSKL